MFSFLLRNALLVANVLANVFGVAVIYAINSHFRLPIDPGLEETLDIFAVLHDVFAFGVIIWFTRRYEGPMRACLALDRPHEAPEPMLTTARRRLLNEPFVLMAINMAMWLLAALIFPSILWLGGAEGVKVGRALAQCLIIGLVTCTMAFFLLEALIQLLYMPRFFPGGGVFKAGRVLRVRIATRVLALFTACGLVPGLVSLLVANGSSRWGMAPETTLIWLQNSMTVNALVFMGTGLCLAVLVTITLAWPFKGMVEVLRRVSRGDLGSYVPVRSNDEIGYTCEVINEMTEGLRERAALRHGLSLADEVQKSLLPRAAPVFPGLDAAGASVSCEKTGGDYFDFLSPDLLAFEDACGVVVGDVSGHGVSSALLMTTVRAMLRMRAGLPCGDGGLGLAVSDVNRLLARDVERSGNFATLFALLWRPHAYEVEYVRAGHDPALIYDPATGAFGELGQGGPVLGVLPDQKYHAERHILTPGQVLFIGSDGIWEARGRGAEMFGKERLREHLRRTAHLPAQEVLDGLLADLEAFHAGQPSRDDVTAVVLKVV